MMANNYTVQMRGKDWKTWTDLLVEKRFYLAIDARAAADEQLQGGPEYRCVRITMNGEPLAWSEGAGWQDWAYAPQGEAGRE